MHYTMMKHNRHLRTQGKCRKNEPQVSVFYISRVFSNAQSVLSQCNTELTNTFLHLLYDNYRGYVALNSSPIDELGGGA